MAEESANAKWYVVHTFSGYENKVAENLNKIIDNRNLRDRIMEVKIPTEKYVEVRRNKEVEKERKLYPSYVLVKMIVDNETWYIVRNTQGVTGFLGTTTVPTPLTQEEVDAMGVEQEAKVEVMYGVGDSVQINEGEFDGFIGRVVNIDGDKKRVTVKINMFGTEAEAELGLTQVSPLSD